MSPTIFRDGGFRYFFFSREESRMHIHVSHQDGAAKFWIEPDVVLAWSSGLSAQQLHEAERFVLGNHKEIANAWRKHFPI